MGRIKRKWEDDDSAATEEAKQPAKKPAKRHSKAWYKEWFENMLPTTLACDPEDVDIYDDIITKFTKDAMSKLDAEKLILKNLQLNSRPTFNLDSYTEASEPLKAVGFNPDSQTMAVTPLAIYDADNKENTWLKPPNGTKRSDEDVYLAYKHMAATDKGKNYPVDFDKNGHIRAARTPKDPHIS